DLAGRRAVPPTIIAYSIRLLPGSPPCKTKRSGLILALFLQHLPATIHAGLEVDVMRAAQLPGILVLDVARALQRVGRPPHAAPRRRSFPLGHGHDRLSSRSFK